MSKLDWKSQRALTVLANAQKVLGEPNSLNRRQGGCAVWINTPVLMGPDTVNGKHIFHKHFVCDIIDTVLISVFKFNLDDASLEILKKYTRAANHKDTLLIMGESFQQNLYHGYLALVLVSRGDFEAAVSTHDIDMALIQTVVPKYSWKLLYGRTFEMTEKSPATELFTLVYKVSTELSRKRRWSKPKYSPETEEKHKQMLARVELKKNEADAKRAAVANARAEAARAGPVAAAPIAGAEHMTDYLYDRYANKIYYPLDSETQIITKTYGTVAQKREYPKYTDIVYYMPSH